MNEPDNRLSESLLSVGAGESARDSAAVPASIAAAVRGRDRSRMRAVAAVSLILWFLAAVGVLFIAYGHFELYLPREVSLLTNPDLLQQEGFRGSEVGLLFLGEVGFWAALATVVCLAAAALSTVALVSFSRRITLRQVDANLAAICDELKKLKAALAEER